MRARRRSRCTPCGSEIKVGDEIEAFLGKWVHTTCKAADIARRAKVAGPAVVIPAEEVVREDEYVGTRHYRRRGVSFVRRTAHR